MTMFGSMHSGAGGGLALKSESLDPRSWMQQNLTQLHDAQAS